MVSSASLFGISMKGDGTFVRTGMPSCEPSPEFEDGGVASKDVLLEGVDPPGLWARIFLPQPPDSEHRNQVTPPPYPLVLYFHGGGFVLLSVAHFLYHRFLRSLARTARIIVVAVEYRLAPEHRLPAAYDDALTSLTWLQSQASPQTCSPYNIEPWLQTYADFSQCYLMGDSAGGNIVHHLSLKVSKAIVHPLCIRSHILIQPFFGGVARTRTEELMANDRSLPLLSTDWLWKNALPEGADRDHPACNPMHLPSSVYRDARLPKTLIMLALKDPMKERQMQYCATLKEAGVDVQVQFQDGSHGFHLVDGTDESTFFIADITSFLRHSSASKL